VQDQFFDDVYFRPAMQWGVDHQFKLPLSALVLYDSFIHSGQILWFLRQRFTENPPSLGGDERKWITAYVNVRHDWLANHPRKILQKTVYRTQAFKDQIAKNNWDLSQLPLMMNGVAVTPG